MMIDPKYFLLTQERAALPEPVESDEEYWERMARTLDRSEGAD